MRLATIDLDWLENEIEKCNIKIQKFNVHTQITFEENATMASIGTLNLIKSKCTILEQKKD